MREFRNFFALEKYSSFPILYRLYINLASVNVFKRNIPNIRSDGLVKAANNIEIRQIHRMKYFFSDESVEL